MTFMQLRIADPLIGLSAIGDLSRGLELGHAARTCFIGCRLARSLGVGDDVVRAVFYTGLLQHIGCIAHAHDTAALDKGRNIEVNAAVDRTDFSRPADIIKTLLTEITEDAGLFTRIRLLLPAARMGRTATRTTCEVAEMTARRIGLPNDVQMAVRHINEWYNGKGGFLRSKGDEIPLAARIVLTAFTVSVFDRLGGPEAALETARSRAGKMLDPAVAAEFVRDGEKILAELESIDLLPALPEEEPDPKIAVDEEAIDDIAIAFGEVVDLKTPFTHGSARRAFDIAGQAAAALGSSEPVVAQTRRAAALRDVGKAALPNAIVERPGRLTEIDWEQVRLHAYQTERVLARSPALGAEAALAGLHHERMDGSGYHRGLSRGSLPVPARVVATTDVLVAMTQPRPYRAAFSMDEAVAALARDPALDPDAVAAVSAAAQGVSGRKRRRLPAGLSERQVEVLRLVSQGLNNREIAGRLVVSPRTAERHVQDIYLKIGVASRAAAALFAVENDLL